MWRVSKHNSSPFYATMNVNIIIIISLPFSMLPQQQPFFLQERLRLPWCKCWMLGIPIRREVNCPHCGIDPHSILQEDLVGWRRRFRDQCELSTLIFWSTQNHVGQFEGRSRPPQWDCIGPSVLAGLIIGVSNRLNARVGPRNSARAHSVRTSAGVGHIDHRSSRLTMRGICQILH